MKNRIVKIEPTESMISLTWLIGIRCNYDCMYCSPAVHDSTSPHPDLDQLKQVWLNFYEKTKHHNLSYKISFTGGEVTANKSFLPLVEFVKSKEFNVGQINVTTNGSASLNYYVKLCQSIDTLSFSTHSEYINEKEFFHKVLELDRIMVRPQKSFHVNVMDEFWNQDRIELYRKWLTKHNISHCVNKIDYTVQTRTQPLLQGVYNIEQL